MNRQINGFKVPIFLLLITWLVSSCSSSYLQFNTSKSAESRYSGLKTIAINHVVLAGAEAKKITDNLGSWSVSKKQLDAGGIENLVRKALIANLIKFSEYKIIDLKDLRDYNEKFQNLRPPSGETLSKADIMLDLAFALSAQEQKGSYHKVINFAHTTQKKRGKKWVTIRNTSQEKVVRTPYSKSRVEMVFLAEVIKIKNGESRVLKNFNGKLVNDRVPEMPLSTMANELAVAMTSAILKNISRYSVIVKRKIDDDSDSSVLKLLKKADLEGAKLKLENMLSDKKKKKSSDLYNLGICYEALGLPGIALQYYQEAHSLNKEKELYITAVGDLE
ncbi:MAG: hypothetical protein GY786_01285 [Proteobacteria bacterium]|nr:hypothetical protein [Pseudomonadota bacterium]